jgi:crossover junction endodeoxyribonuclease RuvC
MTNTLAIDPATATGFAHSSGEHGVWDLSKNRWPDRPGGRWCRLEELILQANEKWGPIEQIVIEEASLGAHAMPVITFHNRLLGNVERVACHLAVPLMFVPIGTLKKFATGSGSATKDQMVRALQTQFGLRVTDHNEADAIWLLKFSQQPRIPERPKVHKKRVQKALAKAPRLF